MSRLNTLRKERARLPGITSLAALLLVVSATAAAAPAAAAPDPALTRYPYLTDSIQASVTINWATSTAGGTTGSVRYGPSGSCTANTKSASKTSINVNGVTEYQWKATIPVSPDTTYCYRTLQGTIDLLGSDSSPAFTSQVTAGSTAPFTFDVFGDWGWTQSGPNPDEANVLAQMAQSGARFAVMTGDTAYNNGSQSNYGDLQQSGIGLSNVFGPSYWAVPGRSLPVFFTIGNHGFSTANTAKVNWPESNAVSTSAGRYVVEPYPSINGSTAKSYPSFWYAFDAGNARFYVLTAAWADTNIGTGTAYSDDAAAHWQPQAAEYQWLANDLATHPRALKFAFWHYPLYSDSRGARSDTSLQGGAGTLQGLLNQYGVNMVFNGHGHGYERNVPDAAGMVSYMLGNGGADLGPVGSPCNPAFDLYAIAASGTSCGSAPSGLSDDHVYGFAKVTVNGQQVTVTPTDEMGRTFDVQTYTFPDGKGGGGTTTLVPTDDATIDQTNATTNYGTTTRLTADASPVQDFLTRFYVPSSCTSVTSAKLTLTVGSSTNNDSVKGGDIYAAANSNWSETTVNWSTAPATSGSVLASLGAVALGTSYTVDVTKAVTGPGPVSFRVRTTSGDAAAYLSKEGSSTSGPRLAVTC
jgi:hypothetical protein